MTRHEFEHYSETDKLTILLERGEKVLNRIFLYYNITLYIVDHLFIEVWYRQTTNTVDKVNVVDMDKIFHLYEKHIKLPDLFNG
ncbi:MAG: hypothetical protein CSA95_03655 [Bacteroidetes bacterium]|nr:MAG: hypothetical protein CSA95_03655 [Bacteroidota bacterium]